MHTHTHAHTHTHTHFPDSSCVTACTPVRQPPSRQDPAWLYAATAARGPEIQAVTKKAERWEGEESTSRQAGRPRPGCLKSPQGTLSWPQQKGQNPAKRPHFPTGQGR